MIERHFQSIIVTVLLAVSGWVAYTTQGTSVKVATLEEKVISLNDKLDMANIQSYRASDADRDLQIRDLRLDRLEDRLDRLEDRPD